MPEKETINYKQMFDLACALGEKKGCLDAKTIGKKLKVSLSSAQKIVFAMLLCGRLEKGKKGYIYRADKKAEVPKGYVFSDALIEDKKDFAEIDKNYISSLLLPALRLSLEMGNVSEGTLQRWLGLHRLRAAEIMDLLAAAGKLKSQSEYNPGRYELNLTPSEYDALFALLSTND